MKRGKEKGGGSSDSLSGALKKEAARLAAAGYAVIPVHGNKLPRQPKKPAVPWRKFQKRIPTEAEIEAGFGDGITALGIVCGRVSRLMVIDFDDALRYQQFCRRFPEHVATYTVKTRRGFHLYFRSDAKRPSHHFQGGDIKAERSYVIAAGSVIGEFTYAAVKDAAPLELCPRELGEILGYLRAEQVGEERLRMTLDVGDDVDIRGLYKRLAGQDGRNNALYRCASAARDRGKSESETVAMLALLHARQPGPSGHAPEDRGERMTEALRTIESAYAGGGGYPSGQGLSVYRGGLPNALREFLLREQGSTVLARLLEIFQLAGWPEHRWFSLREATSLAASYGLNRKSALEALGGEASVFDGRHIIRRRYVEYLDSRGHKRKRRGRPVQVLYQAPMISTLMRLFKLAWSPSDSLAAEDVKSARAYRMALHREYVRRLNPVAPMRALGDRIGVNARTIARYNRDLGIAVVERAGMFRLTRGLLKVLPKRRRHHAKNATSGYWLEAGGGLRFPAWRHIGAQLLKTYAGDVRVCMRRPSKYMAEAGESAREYEEMSAAEFLRLRVLRESGSEEAGLLGSLGGLMEYVKERAAGAVWKRVPLAFDSVVKHIAADKVAETIGGYLMARDGDGKRVRRPVKRGIAYRMLKEYGEGNVFLALADTSRELLLRFAKHALRLGELSRAVDLLSRAAERVDTVTGAFIPLQV